MKVTIVQDKLRGGGTERQSISIIQELLKLDIESQLVVAQSGGKLDAFAKATLGAQVKFCSQSSMAAVPKTLHLLNESMSPCTTLLCMGRWANSIATLIPKRKIQRRIATVRTSRPLPWPYKHGIRNADRVITNSKWALQYALKQCGIRENQSKHFVIHNGLSRAELLEITPNDRETARAKHQIPKDAKILLNVARLDPGKGQADLIKILAHSGSRKRHLFLAGEGPERSALRTLARSLDLDSSVHFLGFHENLTDFLAAADVFVSASQLDSLPNALIEAHAAALPIVAYPTAGIPEIVKQGQTGYLTQNNCIQQLNDLTNQLLNETDNARVFGENGRSHVKKNFDQSQKMSSYLDLLCR